MLTVHHLGVSQSERILWLCEELDVPYTLVRYDRMATGMGPPEYKALHPVGSAPIIQDGETVLPESGAIVEYIIGKYGQGRLSLGPDDPAFADYLFWFHYANGSLMPAESSGMLIRRLGAPDDNPITGWVRRRREAGFKLAEERLATAPYFAGDAFTAADIMMLFPLTTMRAFSQRSLDDCPTIRSYLARIGERPAYQRAMRKGDPDMKPMLA